MLKSPGFGKSVRFLDVFFLAALLVLFPSRGFDAVAVETPPAPVHKETLLPAYQSDLMRVYRLALENDAAYQSQRYRHEAAPEILKQAYAEMMPSIHAGVYYQRTRQQILNTDVAVYGEDTATFPSHAYSLTLTQPLFRYASFVRISQAKEEIERADLEWEAARQDLSLRIAQAYLNALEAYENLEFTRTEVEALTVHFRLANERFDNGLAPITDFHDAKARLAFVTARKFREENRLADALEGLTEITGHSIRRIARLKYSLPPSPFDNTANVSGPTDPDEGMPMTNPDPDDMDAWVAAAVQQNVAVQIRRKSAQVAWQEIDRQRGMRWPTVSLIGEYSRQDEGGSLFGGESDLDTREAMVKVDFPLYQGGAISSKTREALKLYKAAEEELEQEIRAAQRAAKSAFLGVKTAMENTEALAQSVYSSQIALEAKREGFRSGLFPSLVVLDAERDLFQVKVEYVKSQYEYILNSLRLKKAVGTLRREDLAGINQWLE